ncbi:MAG: hypothetical protein HFH86_02705 [Bacilli bacterium]|nr:hypothetical protein [Bacilli bacterium]
MEFKAFQEKKHKRTIMIIAGISTFVLLVGIIIYQSYAMYEQINEYDVIKGDIPSFMSDYDVKVSVVIDGQFQAEIPGKESGKAIEKIECTNNAIATWDYINWSIQVKNLNNTKTKCQLFFKTKYKENILNGTDPVLKDNLIPILIENDGTVKKASLGSEWYNYEKKNWANAVILQDQGIQYGEGEIIPEENIESYFVWIPRYKYKIFDTGNYDTLTGTLEDGKMPSKAQTIEIEFETKSQTISDGNSVGSWLTHPAFTAFNTNGMWVGKFETSYGTNGSEYDNSKINKFAPDMVRIKPNLYSWRGISVSNAFQTSYYYQRAYDSHMMKNTEWGAVAYLSHSSYGIKDAIRINNTFMTGVASLTESTCGHIEKNEECNQYANNFYDTISARYNTEIGALASTTGNISGIYDMSGAGWEYVMGVMKDQNGNPMSGLNNIYHSGFNGIFGCPSCREGDATITNLTTGIDYPDSKYYDSYGYAENTNTYSRRILGDATGEMGPFQTDTTINQKLGSWHGDEGSFVSHWYPYFIRGGLISYGTGAGIFQFHGTYGGGNSGGAYRIVLTF